MFIRSFVKAALIVSFSCASAAEPSSQSSSVSADSEGWYNHIFETELADYKRYKNCISYSADYFSLGHELMVAVLMTERGMNARVKQNNNGTFDLGIYQINQVRLPELQQFDIDAVTLATDQCVNAFMAAYLLKQEIMDADDFWEGVGNYHYGRWGDNPTHHYRYIDKVYRNWLRLAGN